MLCGFWWCDLRDQVSEYVKERILALRRTTDQYHNCACLRANAMKHIPNYFAKGQLTKLFFLFPDPHFKVRVCVVISGEIASLIERFTRTGRLTAS